MRPCSSRLRCTRDIVCDRRAQRSVADAGRDCGGGGMGEACASACVRACVCVCEAAFILPIPLPIPSLPHLPSQVLTGSAESWPEPSLEVDATFAVRRRDGPSAPSAPSLLEEAFGEAVAVADICSSCCFTSFMPRADPVVCMQAGLCARSWRLQQSKSQTNTDTGTQTQVQAHKRAPCPWIWP